MGDQAVVGTDGGSYRSLDQSRIPESLKRHPEDAVGEILDGLRSELQRKACLAASARPRQRHQSMRTNKGPSFRELALATDQRRRLDRQVRAMERPQRRELSLAELVEPLRRRQILEAVLAQVAPFRPGAEKPLGRIREDDLAAVAGTHDPCCAVHVGADVSLVGNSGLTRVNAHTNAHRPCAESVLGLTRGRDRVARAREHDEERISLRVDLDSAVSRERRAQHATMLGKHVRIPVTELVEQACRTLDVREEQRDGSAR